MSFRGNISPLIILSTGAAGAGAALAILGVVESQYYSRWSFSALAYGFGLYGLVGMALGFAYGMLFGGKGRTDRRAFLAYAGRVAVLPTVGLWLVGSAFIIYRDLWKESVARAGFWGWAALLLLPVGAFICAGLARVIGKALCDRSRMAALVILVLSLAGLLFCGSGQSMPELNEELYRPLEKPDARPPIVIIVADALRADVIGAYGSKQVATPNLDAFSAESVRFKQAWSTASWTRPAVASLLTGQYPQSHQTIHKTNRLPESLPTMAGQLSQNGYVSVASVTNVNLAPVFGMGRGFDAYAYHGPKPFLGAPQTARRLFLVELYRLARLRFFPGQRVVSSYYAEGEHVWEVGSELIGPLATAARPFFAYLHFMETHDPYFAHPHDGSAVAQVETPNPSLGKAAEYFDLYRQEVEHWDGLFGEMTTFLKDKGLFERALIVVTSDHGEEFADHGGFWHGTTLFQELVRVPLLIRFPQGAGAGTVRHDPVSLIDLMPTVLSLAQVKSAGELPGSALTDQVPTTARYLFAEEDHQGMILSAVRNGPWKLIRANPDNHRGLPKIQLFNLEKDPQEKRNQAVNETTIREELIKVLQAGPSRAAKPSDTKPEEVKIDSDTEEQLRSLGYTE